MLSHPWLSMKDDYEPKMSDLEFEKYQLKQGDVNFQDIYDDLGNLAKEDWEVQGADNEYSTFDSVESRSFCSEKSVDDDQKEFNLNVSFSGGYLPNTDITRVDKGQGNPQFSGVVVKI